MPRRFLLVCAGLLLLAGTSVAAAPPEVPLVEAVKRGSTESVRSLLDHGVDVNAAEVDGTTAMHWAVRGDARALVDLLISAGASVTASNRFDVTPLWLAGINGNAAIIELLLASGADPNETRAGGHTVLMMAARTGNVDAVRALVAHGADIGAAEATTGQTALMWAAAEDHAGVVEALIDAGAAVHVRSKRGFTALLFASRGGRIEAARALLEAGAEVDAGLPNGIAPLLLATINANFELGALLLDHGADPNADAAGWAALHHLVWTRRPNVGFNNPEPVHRDNVHGLEFARRLLAAGASPNARVKDQLTEDPRVGLTALNRTGATPFLLAAQRTDDELMRVLAEHGADPLLPNEDNTTPLMVAAGVGIFTPGEDPGTNVEALAAVKLALELGGDVAAVDDDGNTALHGAATRGANELVQFLVDRGARLDVTNKRGWTPLTIADGVMLGGTFKRQPASAVLLRRLMNEGPRTTADQPR